MNSNYEVELSWFRVELARQRRELEVVKEELMLTQGGLEELREMIQTRT